MSEASLDWANDDAGYCMSAFHSTLALMHTQSMSKPRQFLKLRKRLTRRSRVTTATIFTPMNPAETPEEHFPLQTVYPRASEPRFVNRYDSHEILLVVDGSCVNNGSVSRIPKAGCSFAYKEYRKPQVYTYVDIDQLGDPHDGPGAVGFALERINSEGEPLAANSNRAKLRAVIAALDYREWQTEGWRRIIVATDLEYVVFGATRWLPIWAKRRWRTTKHRPVANRDLWEELHGSLCKLARVGTQVSFWLISSRDAIKEASVLMRDTKNLAKDVAVETSEVVGPEVEVVG
ncbi:hypothetical protein GGS20DRAFT_63568 [Poronia punctata]|nr:hypothetical protein GGS20DRAFT_63568 [Poronia punctata]